MHMHIPPVLPNKFPPPAAKGLGVPDALVVLGASVGLPNGFVVVFGLKELAFENEEKPPFIPSDMLEQMQTPANGDGQRVSRVNSSNFRTLVIYLKRKPCASK